MTAGALRPGFFSNLPVIDEKSIEQSKVTDEERVLAQLSLSSGWKVLSDYMDELYSSLEDANLRAVSTQSSLEEIGRNTVIISFVRDFVKRVKNKVNDAAEAVSKNGEQ